MEKKCVDIERIMVTLEDAIAQLLKDKQEEQTISRNDILGEWLDSMSICVLIVQLEDTYQIEFPIEWFSKTDTIKTLSEKVFDLWERKD